jgi:hypothetical protein
MRLAQSPIARRLTHPGPIDGGRFGRFVQRRESTSAPGKCEHHADHQNEASAGPRNSHERHRFQVTMARMPGIRAEVMR